jgi:hypothetical protein
MTQSRHCRRRGLWSAAAASSLRGKAFENGFERDPANEVLRAIHLEIDPALVKAVEHPKRKAKL